MAEAHKESTTQMPSSSDLSAYVPLNSDYHSFQQLINSGVAQNTHTNKNRTQGNNGKQMQLPFPFMPPPSLQQSSQLANQSQLPPNTSNLTESANSQSMSMSLSTSPSIMPQTPTSTLQASVSSHSTASHHQQRHLPFPYNLNNFPRTNY